MQNQGHRQTIVARPGPDIGPAKTPWVACCDDCEQKAFKRFNTPGSYIEGYNYNWTEYRRYWDIRQNGDEKSIGSTEEEVCYEIQRNYFNAQWGARELTNRFVKCLSDSCLKHYRYLNTPGFDFLQSIHNLVYDTRHKYFSFPETGWIEDIVITRLCLGPNMLPLDEPYTPDSGSFDWHPPPT